MTSDRINQPGQLAVDPEDQISVSKFKATCLALLEHVRRTGRPLTITKHGVPLARVVPPPVPEASSTWLGSLRDSGEILGDVIAPAGEDADWEALTAAPDRGEGNRRSR